MRSKSTTPQMRDRDYIEASAMLESIRRMQSAALKQNNRMGLLKEEKESEDKDSDKKDAIAITNDPKFGKEVLKSQQDDFRSLVDGGV